VSLQNSRQEFLDRLRSLFRELNDQFFGAQLPDEICVHNLNEKTIIRLPNGQYQAPLPKSFEGLYLDEHKLILIHPRCEGLDHERVREILLHEMCHAAVCQALPSSARNEVHPHGREFIAELRRLAALGEQWADIQARYYSNALRDGH
jgi:predicted SprT family Zn-dependent metalloprotease